MDYKLAKQLKDAGFEQGGKGTYFEISGGLPIQDKGEEIIQGKYYIPTLSELIEACDIPDKRFVLVRSWTKKCWYAQSLNLKEECEHQGNGKTPEEAVAKLWLKLNGIK